MNGVHDMGGMHGFGPIVREEDERLVRAFADHEGGCEVHRIERADGGCHRERGTLEHHAGDRHDSEAVFHDAREAEEGGHA